MDEASAAALMELYAGSIKTAVLAAVEERAMSLLGSLGKIAADQDKLAAGQDKLVASQAEIVTELKSIAASVQSIADSLRTLAEKPEVAGIAVQHGPPKSNLGVPMSKPTIKKVKLSALRGRALVKKPAAAGNDFVLVDNENDTITIAGVDSVGNPVALDPAAVTITASSGDPSVVTVDSPSGLTVKETATGKLSTPGTPVVVTVTATWNDGSRGPFAVTDPIDVVAGLASGVVIQHGPPSINA